MAISFSGLALSHCRSFVARAFTALGSIANSPSCLNQPSSRWSKLTAEPNSAWRTLTGLPVSAGASDTSSAWGRQTMTRPRSTAGWKGNWHVWIALRIGEATRSSIWVWLDGAVVARFKVTYVSVSGKSFASIPALLLAFLGEEGISQQVAVFGDGRWMIALPMAHNM